MACYKHLVCFFHNILIWFCCSQNIYKWKRRFCFMYLFILVDTFIYTMYVYYFACIYYVYFFKLAKLDSKYVIIGLFCILFLFIVYLICDTTINFVLFIYLFILVDTFIYTMYIYYFVCIYCVYFFKLAKSRLFFMYLFIYLFG